MPCNAGLMAKRQQQQQQEAEEANNNDETSDDNNNEMDEEITKLINETEKHHVADSTRRNCRCRTKTVIAFWKADNCIPQSCCNKIMQEVPGRCLNMNVAMSQSISSMIDRGLVHPSLTSIITKSNPNAVFISLLLSNTKRMAR